MENVDPAIPHESKVRLEEILRKHIKAISMNEDDLGRTSLARHHIDTGNAPPSKTRNAKDSSSSCTSRRQSTGKYDSAETYTTIQE